MAPWRHRTRRGRPGPGPPSPVPARRPCSRPAEPCPTFACFSLPLTASLRLAARSRHVPARRWLALHQRGRQLSNVSGRGRFGNRCAKSRAAASSGESFASRAIRSTVASTGWRASRARSPDVTTGVKVRRASGTCSRNPASRMVWAVSLWREGGRAGPELDGIDLDPLDPRIGRVLEATDPAHRCRDRVDGHRPGRLPDRLAEVEARVVEAPARREGHADLAIVFFISDTMRPRGRPMCACAWSLDPARSTSR